MPRQAGFAGFGQADATDRLFLAVLPGAEVAVRAHALAEALKAGSGSQAQPVPASRLHVTLHYFGEFAGVPDALVGAVDKAMRGIGLRAFDACLDRAWSFDGGPHRKPWVLGMSAEEGMQALHAATGRQLAVAGVRAKGGAGFVPHMTVLYDRQALAPRPVDPIRLEIREVALVDSLVGRGEHRVLRRWPLNGIA
jgi:RNA 2',3'-cyclic 3'-phosphodiesterase